MRVLEELAATRGIPEATTIDNGPEFTGKAFDEWAYEKEVSLLFIQPGKPVENAYNESLNGRLQQDQPPQVPGKSKSTGVQPRIEENGVRSHF